MNGSNINNPSSSDLHTNVKVKKQSKMCIALNGNLSQLWSITCHKYNTIQYRKYNTIQFKVKNANGTAVTLQSAMGKRLKTDKS